MARNDWLNIISGGVCTSGTMMNLQDLDRVRVSNYHVGHGAIMRTGELNSLQDIVVDGNLSARGTFICKMTIPTGCASLWGDTTGSRVMVGGQLDCSGKTTLTELSIVNGGRAAVQGSSFIRNTTVCSGGKLTMYGNTSAHLMVISSGASVTLYGQAELTSAQVCSGGYLECWDDTHTSDLYVAEGARFYCHDGAEVIYQRDSPQKPIDFGSSSANQCTESGIVDIYRAKVTVFPNHTVEIHLPVPLEKVFSGNTISWKGTEDDKR